MNKIKKPYKELASLLRNLAEDLQTELEIFSYHVKRYVNARNGKPMTVKVQDEAAEKDTEFRYFVQYHPNPDMITIHARDGFPKGGEVAMDIRYHLERNKSAHPLFTALGEVKGITDAYSCVFNEYELSIGKAKLYTWEELLPKILAAIQIHVANGKPIKQDRKAEHPSPKYLREVEKQNEKMSDVEMFF